MKEIHIEALSIATTDILEDSRHIMAFHYQSFEIIYNKYKRHKTIFTIILKKECFSVLRCKILHGLNVLLYIYIYIYIYT